MREPCMCGADDCHRCHSENFVLHNGRYVYAMRDCPKCESEFQPEDFEDASELCQDCKAAERKMREESEDEV